MAAARRRKTGSNQNLQATENREAVELCFDPPRDLGADQTTDVLLLQILGWAGDIALDS